LGFQSFSETFAFNSLPPDPYFLHLAVDRLTN